MANIPNHLGLFIASLVLCCCLVHGRTVRQQNDDEDQELQDLQDHWPILCPPNSWFSKKQDTCVPCSTCPEDQFIIRPCYRFHDSKCTPSLDFPSHFLSPTSSGSDSSQSTSHGKTHTAGGDSRRGENHWRPATVVLGVMAAVLVTTLLVMSVAVFVIWRRLQAPEPDKEPEGSKLVCAYSPAPSLTV